MTTANAPTRTQVNLGPMPGDRLLRTVDERVIRAPIERIFPLAADVERWPALLAHYRYVRSRDDGVVEMSANRPFGALAWPTWWASTMSVRPPAPGVAPNIRFRHVAGITRGMEVEWTFAPTADGTRVRIVHVWNGPGWPVIGTLAARAVIGPVFVHGIASRTLAGLAAHAERA